VPIDIAAQPLDKALAALARQTGARILFSTDLTENKQAPAVKATLAPQQALERLLAGSGLMLKVLPDGGFTVGPAAEAKSDATLPPVRVTASRDPSVGVEIETLPGGHNARTTAQGLLGNQDAMNTPFAASSYTAAAIQDQHARTVTDLMANDPSIRLPGAADGVYDSFSIRGFQGSTASHSLNGLYGVLPNQNMALHGMERAEIIKGPTSLLTGSGPFGYAGGATNFVPKRAASAPLTAVTVEVSGRGQTGLHLDLGRRFGQTQALGARVNVHARDGATAIDGQSERLGLGVIALDWRSTSARLALDAGVQSYTIERPTFGMTIAPGIAVPRPPVAGANPFPSWTQARSKDRYAVIGGEYDLSPETTVFGAIGRRSADSHIPNAYTNIDDAAGNTTVIPSFEPYRADTRLSLNFGARTRLRTGPVSHNLAAVASLLRYEVGYSYTLDDYSFSSSIYQPVDGSVPAAFFASSRHAPRAASYEDSGASLADRMGFFDERLQLLLGLRLQRFKVDSYDVFSGDALSRYDRRKVSPSAGVVVKLRPSLSWYTNYMVGLGSGPIAPSEADNAGQVFSPIKTEQVETGLKLDWGGGIATLSLFQIEQPSGYTDSISNLFKVAGEQRNRGLELSAIGELTRGLRLSGGASVIDARFTQTDGGLQNGKAVPGVARLGVNLGAEWDVAALPGLTLTGRVIHTGRQQVDPDNTQRIPAWTRLDLGARLALAGAPVTLRLNVNNAADRSYWASSFGSRLTLGAPRTVTLSATATF
jgi:iron complex outermembrane receptor protein